jgi:RNA polymerase sigma-70 factor (ECF subfamily)
LDEQDKIARFEQTVMPHLDAAYNLARWMTGNEHDAEDVVQDACLRAFKFFGGFRGGNSRSWLLAIVRNACYSWLQQNRARNTTMPYDEEIHSVPDDSANPSLMLVQSSNREFIRQAIEGLPVEFREVVVLRELEGLAYKEIADVAGVPIGTVMSRLARARKQLQKSLSGPAQSGGGK